MESKKDCQDFPFSNELSIHPLVDDLSAPLAPHEMVEVASSENSAVAIFSHYSFVKSIRGTEGRLRESIPKQFFGYQFLAHQYGVITNL